MLDADAGRRKNSVATFSEVHRNSIDKTFCVFKAPLWLASSRTILPQLIFDKLEAINVRL